MAMAGTGLGTAHRWRACAHDVRTTERWHTEFTDASSFQRRAGSTDFSSCAELGLDWCKESPFDLPPLTERHRWKHC
jgi:hypothetical protein